MPNPWKITITWKQVLAYVGISAVSMIVWLSLPLIIRGNDNAVYIAGSLLIGALFTFLWERHVGGDFIEWQIILIIFFMNTWSHIHVPYKIIVLPAAMFVSMLAGFGLSKLLRLIMARR